MKYSLEFEKQVLERLEKAVAVQEKICDLLQYHGDNPAVDILVDAYKAQQKEHAGVIVGQTKPEEKKEPTLDQVADQVIANMKSMQQAEREAEAKAWEEAELVPVDPPEESVEEKPKRKSHRVDGHNIKNLVNEEPTVRSTTGVRGVYEVYPGHFEGRVTVNKREITLYRGGDFAEACRARERGVKEYYDPLVQQAIKEGKIEIDEDGKIIKRIGGRRKRKASESTAS